MTLGLPPRRGNRLLWAMWSVNAFAILVLFPWAVLTHRVDWGF